MLDALRARLDSVSGSGWRAGAGLAIMLAAIAQSASAARIEASQVVVAIWLVSGVMTVAWFVMLWHTTAPGAWLLGVAASVLELLLPGPGTTIGVIAAIVVSGLRLPTRFATITAASLGVLFLLATGIASSWASWTGLAFEATGLAFAYVASTGVRRIRLERERAEALLDELQRTRQSEIERAALAERARIAREIHDVLAHTLSALALQLEGTRLLVEQRPGDPAAVAAVERAHRLASEGLAEAKRAIGALRGDRLPGPDGLARLVDDFADSTGTPSHFEVSGEPVPLSSEAQLALFRTAQEALTNVRKHAQATAVDVRLRYQPDGAELLVEDAAPTVSANGGTSSGYGLLGMRERAELVGGTLEAGPLATGFRVRLWLPRA